MTSKTGRVQVKSVVEHWYRTLLERMANSPDAMIQDQSVNNTWKNLVGGLYEIFNKSKPSRQMIDGFKNVIHSSFENLSQEKIQNAIDIQQKIMEQLLLDKEGHTT